MATRTTGWQGLWTDVGGANYIPLTPARSTDDDYRTVGLYWFVDSQVVSTAADGLSWETAFLTMNAALTAANTGDIIIFTGDVREELVGSNLKFDITIIGMGATHHPDSPATGYRTGGACWRPPASPTTATPLLKVRGRGWRFQNILFDCPVDAAALYMERNALSDVSEYDASHFQVVNCRFTSGDTGIQDVGGCSHCFVTNNFFYGLTYAIRCTSTAVALPLNWLINNNRFMDNTNHLVSALSRACIIDNIFGKKTTAAITTTGGAENMIARNALYGTYSIAGGYTGVATDEWGGNYNSLSGGVTASDPA